MGGIHHFKSFKNKFGSLKRQARHFRLLRNRSCSWCTAFKIITKNARLSYSLALNTFRTYILCFSPSYMCSASISLAFNIFRTYIFFFFLLPICALLLFLWLLTPLVHIYSLFFLFLYVYVYSLFANSPFCTDEISIFLISSVRRYSSDLPTTPYVRIK